MGYGRTGKRREIEIRYSLAAATRGRRGCAGDGAVVG